MDKKITRCPVCTKKLRPENGRMTCPDCGFMETVSGSTDELNSYYITSGSYSAGNNTAGNCSSGNTSSDSYSSGNTSSDSYSSGNTSSDSYSSGNTSSGQNTTYTGSTASGKSAVSRSSTSRRRTAAGRKNNGFFRTLFIVYIIFFIAVFAMAIFFIFRPAEKNAEDFAREFIENLDIPELPASQSESNKTVR